LTRINYENLEITSFSRRISGLGSGTYKGEVIVRAESEIKARAMAVKAYVIARRVKADPRTNNDIPWNQTSLVSAVTMQDTRYDQTGSEEILGPPQALRKADL
jgi:hypothetical protein